MLLDEYYKENYSFIKKALEESKYVYTSKALQRFFIKCQSISNIIQNLQLKDDSYPGYLLMRSQIEHFLVIFYIWLKFRIDNNDKTAKKYYKAYPIQEFMKRYGYIKDSNIPSSSRYMISISSIIEILTSKGYIRDEDIKKYKNINRKLNEIKNEFSVVKISKFLDENLPDNFTPFITPTKVKNLLENYNYLSTFVHGGPTAEIMLFEVESKLLEESIGGYKELSSNLISVHRFFILYFLAHENDKIKNEMREFTDNEIDKKGS